MIQQCHVVSPKCLYLIVLIHFENMGIQSLYGGAKSFFFCFSFKRMCWVLLNGTGNRVFSSVSMGDDSDYKFGMSFCE